MRQDSIVFGIIGKRALATFLRKSKAGLSRPYGSNFGFVDMHIDNFLVRVASSLSWLHALIVVQASYASESKAHNSLIWALCYLSSGLKPFVSARIMIIMAKRQLGTYIFLLIGHIFLSCECTATNVHYEVWAADQSNTAPGQTGLGVKGGLLWIWDGKDIERLVANGGRRADPMPCTPNAQQGPCDILQMFPPDLLSDSTATRLGDLPGFGRLHGALIDPYNKYAALSMFVPGGGYVGIVDTTTKEAIALFRATRFRLKVAGVDTFGRSVHMNFWTQVRINCSITRSPQVRIRR